MCKEIQSAANKDV